MNKRRIVLITGATGGIGKAAATAMAKRDYIVIIHGRNEEKTRQVAIEIQKISGNKNVDWIIGDLFLLAEVRKIATNFKKKYDRLDILINNAGGIMGKKRENTSEGIEKTIAINLLAPFLLTGLLLDLLEKSDEGRIINVSSNSHQLNANPDFKDLELKNNYTPLRAYGNVKLFLIWISQTLSEKLILLNTNNPTVNTLHPGAISTNFGVNSDLGILLNIIGKIARPFLKTPEQGTETIIYLATSSEVKNISGKYFVKNKLANVSDKYYSKQNKELIWDYCLEKTKIQ
ncbi:SDR family NAD(P)-dependent oxidoreductase [Mucilaginibacter sp. E4BP6]|uniref:SDR family NAD(P)-dependent oxidoreductase n=1 Tax=Mucilaginibacter sp. E4BP6 TaxID=2723089 RepID=UPI0015C9B828|nr:SDR family NAD(P)-dependent oxidoreductase [Mucilaginibacter sp. E4BP6]NYE64970.1 NAD(P)-dependent dehydrogenase (short-subunit alcohol dehydrogenase family) [Mucilaginibacter sp. E4BP6]